jgi:pyruvate-ferredoxin/flavodoxin oxidoreductase
MAAIYQAAWPTGGRTCKGTPLRFIEPESEHSSASAAEGAALAGARVTNFTAGQGLILMKEVLRHRRQAPPGRIPHRRSR